MTWSYERSMNHTYLVYEGIENDNKYEIQMILRNPIKGILTSHLDKIDGNVRLFYEISSKQPLSSVYEKKKMNYNSLKALLQSMQMVLNRMEEYLLSTEYLITDPNMIYVNPGKDEYYFCLIPDRQEEIGSLHILMEYLLECIDYADERAVAAAYEWYKKSKEDNFSFVKIYHDVFDGNQNSRHRMDCAQQDQNKQPLFTAQCNRLEEMPEDNTEKFTESIRDTNTLTESETQNNSEEQKCSKKLFSRFILAAAAVLAVVILIALVGIAIDFYRYIMERVLIAAIVAGAAGIFLWYRKTAEYQEADDTFDFLSEDNSDESDQKIWIDEDGVYRTGNKTTVEEASTVDEAKDSLIKEDVYEETVYFHNDKINGSRILESVNQKFPEYRIEIFPFILGKLEGAVDGIVNDNTVSRIHCKIEMEEGEYYITDLNSTNGTIVNGTALCTNTKTNLQIGDEILIGKAAYRFY